MSSLKDVARVSGLSVATISKYLNGIYIKEQNRKKIDEAIQQLDYHVNYIAKGLKTHSSMTVGVLIPTLDSRFYSSIVSRLEKKLAQCGKNVLICDYDNNEVLENKKFLSLLSRQVDQIVAVPTYLTQKALDTAKKNNVQVIFFDRIIDNIENVSVLTDNYDISYAAVEKLINRGRKNILFVAPHNDFYTTKERLRGAYDALEKAQVKVKFEVCEIQGGSEKAYLGCKQALFDRHDIDAVFALSSSTMLGAIMAIRELNFSIPNDLSFIGFDNLQIAKIYSPKLSCISQPLDDIAGKVVELILQSEKAGFDQKQPIVLKSELIETESL